AGIPDQPNVFYIGMVNGGIWRTDNAGRTWTPIFDAESSGSIGALAIAPSDPDIIYAGSGEGLQRPDLAVGNGMYKSTDGGKTWTRLGLRDGQQFAQILVDPHDPNRVIVAVVGHPYGPNAERGVFRSTDGGQTWQKVLYRDENTGAADLAFDPANPKIIYAVLWAARVAPWEVRSGESFITGGSGLYKSTDGGDTWKQLTNGLPGADDRLGRIGIAVAPSNGQRLYASVEARKNPGVYRSDDGGETWAQVNGDRRIGGRGPGAMGIAVAPDNPDEVYVANTASYRSMDGGHTFTCFKGAPGGDDYQRFWINPRNPRIIALSADQGATISVDHGTTWSSWYNQPTAQFYHVTTDTRVPYWVYGAQQESGSIATASRGDDGSITFRDWHPVGVEEYGYIAVDPLNPDIVYGGRVTRTNQRTGEVADVAPEPIRRGQYRYNRTMPVVFSPLDPHTLYATANVVFKTTNGGESWQVISPDLTRENPAVPASLGVFKETDPEHGKHRGLIYALAPSPKDIGLIWAGTDDGQIQVTHNGGGQWTNVTPPSLVPWSKVSMIEASHFDAGEAYAAINAFRLDDLRPHVLRTRDSGKTWQEITSGLPGDEPVNAVREDPARRGLLYAGTEGSVYVSFDDGDHWQSLQLNLPHTSMRDLVVHGDDLVVGTHGRSFWILDDLTPLRQLTAQVAAAEVHLFKPETAWRFRRSRATDTPLPPEVPAGQNPPDGAIIDYYLKDAATGAVRLEILDGRGEVVRRYASTDAAIDMAATAKSNPIPMYWVLQPKILSAEAGMHRFVWDLHYTAPSSLFHGYPISAVPHATPLEPEGVRALPNSYTVRLTVGGKSWTQPLTLKMDPRVKAEAGALGRQFAMESDAVRGMDESYAALETVKTVREQLKDRAEKAGKGELSEAIAAMDKKLAALEGAQLQGFFGVPPTGHEKENLSTLNQHFGALLRIADSCDCVPPTQVQAEARELNLARIAVLGDWRGIEAQSLPALNKQLEKAGLSPVDTKRSSNAGMSPEAEDEDEP
ncbi:MAG TPA: glycoside hydrolase, partial [Patescibacteria group bacterium]|nr:glycoside hydrolase [Patescibacteria group bacterium]